MIRDFEYFAPKTVEEALTLLSQYNEESKVIAGGQSLLVLMRQGLVSPKYLIDIKGISALDFINLDKNEGLRIGALTPHRAIEKSPVIRNGFAVLSEMELKLASVQTRNWGTIGGNLCHADPAGDPAPVLIALNGNLKLASLSGERTVAVEDFSTDYFETVLHHGELLTEIQVPNPPPRTGAAYSKFNIIENDMGIVSTAVSITLNPKNETCSDARIVLGAVSAVPMRAKEAEKVLVGKEISDALLVKAGQIASEETEPITDVLASEEYKRELVRVLVKRVAREALDRARR
ncbi:6-hydroxypseudooxynicotine dehydrogenase complex subunit alpha [subsurface metagenome]